MRRAHPDFSSPPGPSSDWLTAPEVASLLRVHHKHVYRLLHQGMPARRVGGQWRFSREAIQTWADARGELLRGPAKDAPETNTAWPILAGRLNDVTEAIVCALVEASGLRLAITPASPRESLELLDSGEIAAAIVPRDSHAGCATVRISLGEWELAVRVDAIEEPHVSRICMAAQSDLVRVRLGSVMLDATVAGQMRLQAGVQKGPAATIASGDTAPKASTDRRPATRWTVLTRDRAEQMLALVALLRDRGLRVGGFVQVPAGPPSARPLGYDLFRLSRPERLAVAERTTEPRSVSERAGTSDARRRKASQDHAEPAQERHCELTFHTEALARACEWLREDVSGSDLLIVDGVGRLEERGQGLFPALAWARMQARPRMILLSSRREHMPAIAQRLALTARSMTTLSLGSSTTTPSRVVEQILRGCGAASGRGKAHPR